MGFFGFGREPGLPPVPPEAKPIKNIEQERNFNTRDASEGELVDSLINGRDIACWDNPSVNLRECTIEDLDRSENSTHNQAFAIMYKRKVVGFTTLNPEQFKAKIN